MKRYGKGFYMSLGLFSAIPLPVRMWDDACANLMLPCFPLVGGMIGGLWWGLSQALALGGTHPVLSAALLSVFPFAITGFMHLDGYMDTSDAVLSRRPQEDKLRILKDPHTGAFSVIMLAVLLLLQFAILYIIVEKGNYPALLLSIPVIARCCPALSLLSLKALPQSGYANLFRRNTGMPHKAFVAFTAISAAALSYRFAGIRGLAVAASTALGAAVAMAYAYKELKGVSGDLAGFSLVIGELCGLFALSTAQ